MRNPRAALALEMLAALSHEDWAEMLTLVSETIAAPDPKIVPIFPDAPEAAKKKRRTGYTRSVKGANVERLYTKEQMSLRAVGKVTGLPVREVKSILRKRGIKLRRHIMKNLAAAKPRKTRKSRATGGRIVQMGDANKIMDEKAAIELYQEHPNVTVKQVANLSGIGYWRLLDLLHGAGVKVRRAGPHTKQVAISA